MMLTGNRRNWILLPKQGRYTVYMYFLIYKGPSELYHFSNFKNISQRFTQAKVLRRVSHKEETNMKTLNDFKMTKEFCQFTKGMH